MPHTTRPARLRAAVLAGLALALWTVRIDAQTLPDYVPAGASLKYEADVKAFEEASGQKVPYEIVDRRPGEEYTSYIYVI